MKRPTLPNKRGSMIVTRGASEELEDTTYEARVGGRGGQEVKDREGRQEVLRCRREVLLDGDDVVGDGVGPLP